MVVCDTCKKDFNMDVRVTKLDDEIEKVHFYCLYCNQEYISYFTDEEIRKKQKKVRFIKDKNKNKKMKSEILRDMQNLAAVILDTQ